MLGENETNWTDPNLEPGVIPAQKHDNSENLTTLINRSCLKIFHAFERTKT